VPAASLHPEAAWSDKADFSATLSKLGRMFLSDFEHFHNTSAC
jgi:phosphoenolpyruvate carboxykinase (ATP)